MGGEDLTCPWPNGPGKLLMEMYEQSAQNINLEDENRVKLPDIGYVPVDGSDEHQLSLVDLLEEMPDPAEVVEVDSDCHSNRSVSNVSIDASWKDTIKADRTTAFFFITSVADNKRIGRLEDVNERTKTATCQRHQTKCGCMITRRIVDEDPVAGMRLLHENLMEWLSKAPDVDKLEHQRLGKLLKIAHGMKPR